MEVISLRNKKILRLRAYTNKIAMMVQRRWRMVSLGTPLRALSPVPVGTHRRRTPPLILPYRGPSQVPPRTPKRGISPPHSVSRLQPKTPPANIERQQPNPKTSTANPIKDIHTSSKATYTTSKDTNTISKITHQPPNPGRHTPQPPAMEDVRIDQAFAYRTLWSNWACFLI